MEPETRWLDDAAAAAMHEQGCCETSIMSYGDQKAQLCPFFWRRDLLANAFSDRTLLGFLVLTMTMTRAEYNKSTPDRTANTCSSTLLKPDMIISCPKNLIGNAVFLEIIRVLFHSLVTMFGRTLSSFVFVTDEAAVARDF